MSDIILKWTKFIMQLVEALMRAIIVPCIYWPPNGKYSNSEIPNRPSDCLSSINMDFLFFCYLFVPFFSKTEKNRLRLIVDNHEIIFLCRYSTLGMLI